MTNPLIIFFQWLNPLKKKKTKRMNLSPINEWFIGNATDLLKIALLTALLFPILIYYVKCNEVPINLTEVGVWRMHYDPRAAKAELSLDITRDYIRSNEREPIQHGFDMHADSLQSISIDPNKSKISYDLAVFKRKDDYPDPLPIYSNEALDKLWFSELIELKEKHKSDTVRKWNDFRYAYKVTIISSNSKSYPFLAGRTSKERFYGTPEQTLIGRYTIHRNNIWFEDYFLATSIGKDNARADIMHEEISGNYLQISKNFWTSAMDVSQAKEVLKIYNPTNLHTMSHVTLKKLKFYYNGATEFSDMYPTPDIITYNSIEFTDSAKLAEINSNGITFHTKFPDMLNKQQARTFAVTTVITLLITLLLKYLYNISSGVWKWMRIKHKIVLRIAIAIVLLLPSILLFLII